MSTLSPLQSFVVGGHAGLPVAAHGLAALVGPGPGVIIFDDGLALTNSHVVARARRVGFSEGGEGEAEVIGGDPGTDLALLARRYRRSALAGATLPLFHLFQNQEHHGPRAGRSLVDCEEHESGH